MAKVEKYNQIREKLDDFLVSYSPKLDKIGLMATISSLVKSAFPSLIFVGFYLMKNIQGENILEIGPYQGDVLACGRIYLGDGVCGKAAQLKEIQLVPNVLEYEGYIACDSDTKSEIVLPLYENSEVSAVFDLDHGDFNYFDEIDKENLQQLLTYIS